MSSLVPGSIIAFLVVKSAISFRNEYLSWQGERRRCLEALTSRDSQLLERIQHARDRELDANQWYSVMLGLLVANLHLMVWIIVVASIYLSLLHQETSARKMWVVLQILERIEATAPELHDTGSNLCRIRQTSLTGNFTNHARVKRPVC